MNFSKFILHFCFYFFSDKQADSTSAQFRFDSIDENASGKQFAFCFVLSFEDGIKRILVHKYLNRSLPLSDVIGHELMFNFRYYC